MDQSLGPPPVTMNPESLNAMSRNFWNSAILRAGLKLDVFGLLENIGSKAAGISGSELSEIIGADDRFLHAFLEACVALGLLEQQDGSYRNSPAASSFYDQGQGPVRWRLDTSHNQSLGRVGPVGPVSQRRQDTASL